MIVTTTTLVVTTLADKAAAVDRFGLTDPRVLDDWTVVVDPELDGMVLRWDYCRLTVGSLGDLALAVAVADHRTGARQDVDAIVMDARRALGWGRGVPYVRCVVCRTSHPASDLHRPGSPACRDTRTERLVDHAS